MLLPEDYDAWLGSMTTPEDLRNLLQPYDESLMEAYAVSLKVNRGKNDTLECIEGSSRTGLEARQRQGARAGVDCLALRPRRLVLPHALRPTRASASEVTRTRPASSTLVPAS